MLLIAGALGLSPSLSRPVAPLPGAQGAMIATLICFNLITSFLLFAQFFSSRSRPLIFLCAAYLYATLMGLPYLFEYAAALPSGATQLGSPIATDWLSIFWSAGFATLTLVYAIAQSKDTTQLGEKDAWQLIGNALFAVTGVVAVLGLPVVVWRVLPPAPHFIGPLLVALCVASLLTTATLSRGRTVLHLWLLVALVALLLDVTMTTGFPTAGTLGWYIAMFYRVLTSTLLLVPLLAELTAVSARMSTLAGLDGLTGLPNRRALDDQIEHFLSDGRRRNDIVAVLMIDIDHFKPFNDTYGHAAGDEALRAVAKVIKRSLGRSNDFVGRYGGEEFVVMLPDTDRDGALVVAERIRAAVSRLPVRFAPALQRITVSIGVASVQRSEIASGAQILGMADRALYNAKGAGRNMVMEAGAMFGAVQPSRPHDGDAAVS
jgi:diguanylate cyclase (GGDEF)-like protein